MTPVVIAARSSGMSPGEETMPMHDWTRVDAGIFHAFHHEWISEIFRALNGGLLPDAYYALPEQVAAGFGPDVLTLQGQAPDEDPTAEGGGTATATLLQARPRTRFTAETPAEFYRRKKSSIVVRHVSGDRIVAMIEIVSPGNKSNRHAFRALVDKACELLEYRIHLLIVDPFPTRPPRSQRGSRRHLGTGRGRSLSAPRGSAADAGRLRVRSHHPGLHRAGRGRPGAAGHAAVPGAQWLCHGASGSDVCDGVRRHAQKVADCAHRGPVMNPSAGSINASAVFC